MAAAPSTTTISAPAAERGEVDSGAVNIAGERTELLAELTATEGPGAASAGRAPRADAAATLVQAVSAEQEPRQTWVHVRGDFLARGPDVEPHTPEALPPLTARGLTPDRLDLARWLTSAAHPLTVRATANRLWQQHFGRGVVSTVDDFGTQGEAPSHPELLDWLASELRDGGWRLKRLHRLIVTSATYRQASVALPELVDLDPYNALLARQNRLRVEAEIVRDLALATCGLLHPAIGGPSVRPPQSDGVADLTFAGGLPWKASRGVDRYRRGLYTWFQRTSPYPMLLTFDAPEATLTCVRRDRSTTPLEALTMLNDEAFVECAQALGRRMARRSSVSATCTRPCCTCWASTIAD